MSEHNIQKWVGPKARVEYITSEEVLDEYVVYDMETNQAHSLNETAAYVWRLCDGQTVPDAMAQKMSAKYDMPEAEMKTIVTMALDNLAEANLLEAESYKASSRGVSRRSVLSKLAVGSLAFLIPTVYTLSVPSSTAHATGIDSYNDYNRKLEVFGNGYGCRSDSDCPPNTRCINGACR